MVWMRPLWKSASSFIVLLVSWSLHAGTAGSCCSKISTPDWCGATGQSR
jgi:hypothetical protein